MNDRPLAPRTSPLSAVLAEFRRPATRAPQLVALLTYLVGLTDITTGLARAWRHRLHLLADVVPGAVVDAASAATVVSGILLLLLAHALGRRKRRAWRAVVLLLAVSVVLHAVRVEPLGGLVSLVLLGALLLYRGEFRALGDPGTRWRALRVGVLLLVTSVGLGLLAVWLARSRVAGGTPPIGEALTEVSAGLVGLSGPLVFTDDRMTDVIGSLLLGLGLMTLLTTAYLALRSPEPRPQLTAEDEAGMRALLADSPDSLGYFNLRRDKSVIWSDSGKAAIAYRVVSGVMLASGDPLGDPEAWRGAIASFLREAQAHAWTPAVLGCSERAGTVWTRETGFRALELGDEAVVEVAAFSLQGRAMRNVRQMVGRIERAGYTTEVLRAADVSDGDRRRALADAASWRASETERGFSMALGRLVEADDPECVLVVARQDGVMRAFLQFVPWGRDGLSLDVMRRDRLAEAGVNELLIVEALRAAESLGVRRLSLNFAAFRSALERGERLGAGPVIRAWRGLLLFASRWLQIESLYRFNAKFQPQWKPRYVIYPGARDLPRVAMAALEAEAFLTWPRLRILKGGR